MKNSFLYKYAVYMKSYVYVAAVCYKIVFDVLTVVFFHKSYHKCLARSGPFLQFRSLITKISMYNVNFQYTQDKLSVLDICVEKEKILLL